MKKISNLRNYTEEELKQAKASLIHLKMNKNMTELSRMENLPEMDYNSFLRDTPNLINLEENIREIENYKYNDLIKNNVANDISSYKEDNYFSNNVYRMLRNEGNINNSNLPEDPETKYLLNLNYQPNIDIDYPPINNNYLRRNSDNYEKSKIQYAYPKISDYTAKLLKSRADQILLDQTLINNYPYKNKNRNSSTNSYMTNKFENENQNEIIDNKLFSDRFTNNRENFINSRNLFEYDHPVLPQDLNEYNILNHDFLSNNVRKFDSEYNEPSNYSYKNTNQTGKYRCDRCGRLIPSIQVPRHETICRFSQVNRMKFDELKKRNRFIEDTTKRTNKVNINPDPTNSNPFIKEKDSNTNLYSSPKNINNLRMRCSYCGRNFYKTELDAHYLYCKENKEILRKNENKSINTSFSPSFNKYPTKKYLFYN